LAGAFAAFGSSGRQAAGAMDTHSAGQRARRDGPCVAF